MPAQGWTDGGGGFRSADPTVLGPAGGGRSGTAQGPVGDCPQGCAERRRGLRFAAANAKIVWLERRLRWYRGGLRSGGTDGRRGRRGLRRSGGHIAGMVRQAEMTATTTAIRVAAHQHPQGERARAGMQVGEARRMSGRSGLSRRVAHRRLGCQTQPPMSTSSGGAITVPPSVVRPAEARPTTARGRAGADTEGPVRLDPAQVGSTARRLCDQCAGPAPRAGRVPAVHQLDTPPSGGPTKTTCATAGGRGDQDVGVCGCSTSSGS